MSTFCGSDPPHAEGDSDFYSDVGSDSKSADDSLLNRESDEVGGSHVVVDGVFEADSGEHSGVGLRVSVGKRGMAQAPLGDEVLRLGDSSSINSNSTVGFWKASLDLLRSEERGAGESQPGGSSLMTTLLFLTDWRNVFRKQKKFRVNQYSYFSIAINARGFDKLTSNCSLDFSCSSGTHEFALLGRPFQLTRKSLLPLRSRTPKISLIREGSPIFGPHFRGLCLSSSDSSLCLFLVFRPPPEGIFNMK